jgi:hypothetical protein
MKKDHYVGSSYEMAKNRFLALERKLSRDSVLKEKYISFMREYQELRHMEKVPKEDLEEREVYYLPHHAVQHPDKPDKLRVVFDASAKTTNGLSLNDILCSGPTIQEDLFSIILRFRTRKFAFAADIIKMYRQILIDQSQAKYQRIIWREDQRVPLEVFQLLTVTYGESPSSFLATRCLKELAKIYGDEYPREAAILSKDFYMDDVLTGADSIEEVMTIKSNLTKLLKLGCMELSKWCTNSPELLQSISDQEQSRRN